MRERFNLPGNAHELTFSCYEKQPFLKSDIICRFLAEAVIRAGNIHALRIMAYVFMPNHVHLLIMPQSQTYDISKILQTIKQSAARRVLIYSRRQKQGLLKYMETGQKENPTGFGRQVVGTTEI